MKRTLAVGLSPAIQKTITFKGLSIDAVNRSTGYRLDASGKAVNAARVMNQLEPGSAIVLCPLGRENAQAFLNLARGDALAVEYVEVPGRVRHCYTLVEPGAGRATELVVGEPDEAGDWAKIADALLERVAVLLDGVDALLFAGSRPFTWPPDLPARIVALAKERGRAVMADFHGPDLSLTLARAAPDIIKINEEEFCGTFGYGFPLAEDELARLIGERSAETGSLIVVTRGSRDTLAAAGGAGYRGRVERVPALNAIGCGDAFNAGFLRAWLAEGDVALALERGAWCATRNALSLRPGSIRDPDAEGEGLL
jgi:fructose-1-phosphate kinase PfkB-like protein